MRRTNIFLADEQLDGLRTLAALRGESVATVVRDAVDQYLEQHLDRDKVVSRLDDILARLSARVPATTDPNEIERDITIAREEVRTARRHARSR
jgi:hypothetical protein